MSQKIFDNYLVVIPKSKVTFTFNKKQVYVGIRKLDLSKVLMCKFQYDYIKNKYDINPRLLFNDTEIMIYEIKTEDIYENYNKDEEMFDFSNYSAKSRYYADSN